MVRTGIYPNLNLEKEEKELDKKIIKEYGGKFQGDVIKELIGTNSHLKRIRSYIGWILTIIIIGIIITMFRLLI